MAETRRTQVIVIGSGAGGSTTAYELAKRGYDVLILEEGGRYPLSQYGAETPEAMRRLYRRRGMTPIMGPVSVGYVEGCCVGGSTEINSGFWHRTPREILLRWKIQFDLADATPEELAPHFDWAEEAVNVGHSPKEWPKSTEVFSRAAEAMGWSYQHVVRAAKDCTNTNKCAMGCPKGAKQGVSRNVVPQAEAAGAHVISNARVKLVLRRGSRVTGVVASIRQPDGSEEVVRFEADYVFVCAGPTETPSLLRRSGIRLHVGDTLRIHPMLKVVARYDEEINAHESVLPMIQIKEFWPDVSFGGSFYSPGHLALNLSENWPSTRSHMPDYRNMGAYYVAVRGTGTGSVRPSMLGEDSTLLRYNLSDADLVNLSNGLARLATALLAGGAKEVYPCVFGVPAITTELGAMRWLDERLNKSALSLTTVHAFSTCPIGERRDRCTADSYGKVYNYDNLYINDASMLPDSPGVNPQGTVMALARRNAIHFAETRQ